LHIILIDAGQIGTHDDGIVAMLHVDLRSPKVWRLPVIVTH
jgi:hypothetical protein